MKDCEICGNELVGKQQRFCCKRCRNVAAGRESGRRHTPKPEIASYYLLPPEGQGLSTSQIAQLYNVTDVTVQNWVKKLGIQQDAHQRLLYFARQERSPRIPVPDRKVLEAMYKMPPEGQGYTQDQMAEHFKVSRRTLWIWLKRYGLLEPHGNRHALRMAGERNPAFTNGHSRHYHKNTLLRSGKLKRCEWCRSEKRLQVHHKDHNTLNGELQNLGWLCQNCNLLEVRLWKLQQTGYGQVEVKNRQIIITFQVS